jgi:probable F420-dependent oxidoreductase
VKYGTNLSFTGMGADAAALRDYAQGLDGAGFNYIGLGGHSLSTELGRFDRPAGTYVGPFRDPFVLFSNLAATTQNLHFVTAILILPEMPTALVAKQAAELQNISNGRFEMGVGISWSPPEFQAFGAGADFETRGRKMAEQVTLMRRFWSEKYVTFEGRYHHIDNMGIGSLPSTPIPVWYGSNLLKRIARLADGWMPIGDPAPNIPPLKEALTAAGRDASTFQIMGRVPAGDDGPEAWVAEARRLQSLGATHLSLGAPPTMDGDLSQALARITQAKNAIESALSA